MTFLCLLGADTGARGSTRSVSSPTAAPGPGCLLRHSHGPFEGPGFNPGVLAARVSLELAQPGHNPGVTGWAGRLLCPPQPEHSTASPCQNSPGSSVGGGSRGPKGRRGTVTNEDGTGGISLSRLAPVKAMAGHSVEEAGNREQIQSGGITRARIGPGVRPETELQSFTPRLHPQPRGLPDTARRGFRGSSLAPRPSHPRGREDGPGRHPSVHPAVIPPHPGSVRRLLQNHGHLLWPHFAVTKYTKFISSGRGSLGQSPAPSTARDSFGSKATGTANLLCSLNICECFAGKISLCLLL